MGITYSNTATARCNPSISIPYSSTISPGMIDNGSYCKKKNPILSISNGSTIATLTVTCPYVEVNCGTYQYCADKYSKTTASCTTEIVRVHPTKAPTPVPTVSPTAAPTKAPTPVPTVSPTAAPTSAPTQSPTVSSSPSFSIITSNDVQVTFTGFSGMTKSEVEDLVAGLEAITVQAIISTITAHNFEIDASSISISSTVVSSSSRKLHGIESRFLQGSYEIQQVATIDAPPSTVNAGTINSNVATGISNAVSAGNSNLQSVSSQAAVIPEYEEPPSPCAGVTCSNAGKCQVTSPTTALCKCENTFLPSESGRECICADGLNFHADVNRCLPPPTAAPTNPPTKSPTLAPTATPTETAIEVEGPECIDDEFGTFKLFNVMEEVECSWLTKNQDKKRVRKQKHCGRDEVKSLCQSTCGACTCTDCTGCDDKEGTFTLPNMKKRETCAWLTKNKLKIEERKEAYCALDEVRDMCKASCGVCAVEDENERV